MIKIKRQKQLIAAGLLWLAASQTAIAHTITGSLLPANGISATDYYEIDCGHDIVGKPVTNTHHLEFMIQDLGADDTQVGVTGFSAGAGANAKAYTVIDPSGGNWPNPPSAPLTIVGGSGKYYLSVFKTGPAFQIYSLSAWCEDINGTTTNARSLYLTTPSSLISNQ